MMDGTIIWQNPIEGLQVSEFILFLGFLQKLKERNIKFSQQMQHWSVSFRPQYMDGVYLPDRTAPAQPPQDKQHSHERPIWSHVLQKQSVLSVAFGEMTLFI